MNFETEVSVCAHRVAIRYWGFASILTPELEKYLTEEGENRSQECIVNGCREGELCAYWEADGQEEEIRGWWEIK